MSEWYLRGIKKYDIARENNELPKNEASIVFWQEIQQLTKERHMNLQEITGRVRNAADEYSMINDGDSIAVGLSGGKDSATLLYALAKLREYYPKKFTLTGITISLGFESQDFSPISRMCEELKIPHELIETEIGDIVFNVRKEKNPCSLCSKMRKGALNNAAVKYSNKIALAHNKDDYIETFFMSLFYEGRLHTFSPVSYLDRTGLTQIRPLIYTDEADIIRFVRKNDIEIIKNPCPANGFSKREYIKNFIAAQSADHDNFRAKVFTAVKTLTPPK